MMKFTDNEMIVLKNFSTINMGILLRPGKKQRTLHPDKVLFAEFELQEDMPVTFGIYDLPNFLNNISLLDNPDLQFDEDKVVMNANQYDMTYYKSDPQLILSPGAQELKLENPKVSFVLPKDEFERITRIAAMNDFPNLTVVGKDGKLTIRAHNKVVEKSSDTSNSVVFNLGVEYNGDNDFEAVFKTSNLKLLPLDYEISIGDFAVFENTSNKLRYIVALQKV